MAQDIVLDHRQLGEVRGDGVGLHGHGGSFDAGEAAIGTLPA
jgi:hypothetical protein